MIVERGFLCVEGGVSVGFLCFGGGGGVGGLMGFLLVWGGLL